MGTFVLNGALAERYAYSPFGQVNAPSHPAIGNPYLFAGREFDSETGLYYSRARYYDPDMGRFLSTDPLLRHCVIGAWLLLVLSAGTASANESEGRGTVLLVFDCYVTLPEGFVVKTRETEYTSLYLRRFLTNVRIKIRSYDGEVDGDVLRLIHSRREEGLAVEEYRSFRIEELGLDPEYRLVRIHDEKQEMNISGSGATDELVQSILESCASDRRTPIE